MRTRRLMCRPTWRGTATNDGGYRHDHDEPDAFSGQEYFPEEMGHERYYDPPERGFEREVRKRLALRAKLRKERIKEG